MKGKEKKHDGFIRDVNDNDMYPIIQPTHLINKSYSLIHHPILIIPQKIPANPLKLCKCGDAACQLETLIFDDNDDDLGNQ